MITFLIKQRLDGSWCPNHPELENVYSLSSTEDSEETIRANLFASVDYDHPGEYTLEWPIEDARVNKVRAVQARTSALLAQGFSYQSASYGLSAQDQAYHNLLRVQALTEAVTYPVEAAAVDNASGFSATGAVELAGFLDAAAAAVRAIHDGDAALKQEVREATTSAEVQAIEDLR